MILFVRLAILTTLVVNILADHFRGGTISWKSVGGNTVEFYFKMGWTLGLGPGCTAQKIGDFVDDPLLNGKALIPSDWVCIQGCQGQPILHSPSYYCMAADAHENWEQGQMNFTYTFKNSGPFVIAFEGQNWMTLGNSKGNGPWSISTTVDLRFRNDTGKPNTTPVALSQTMYYMQFNCKHVLRVPVLDADGDSVRCEWAAGDECKSVCNGLPKAALDPQACTITFESSAANNYQVAEYYAVALTIRDYPQTTIKLNGQDMKTPSDSLSGVPMQFLIKTPTFPVACDEKPRFVSPTPAEGSELIAQAGEHLKIQVAADNSNDVTKKIQTIDVMGPLGLRQSILASTAGVTNTFHKELNWPTSDADIGEHIVCARAVNERGKTGDPRCFTIKIVSDPCDNKPCLNGGTCHSSKGNFTCSCVPGFTGRICETDIDDCSPNPCQNGGTCHDLVNDYRCTCVAGYTDKGCSTDIDDCSPNPCQNGGTCRDLVNDYSCTCLAGYTDKDCSTDIDDCSNPNPCQNGGTCHDLVNNFSCTCVAGYTDKKCSTDIDDCSPNPCQNGGICHDLINDYSCTCVAGYTDKDCSTDIDDCSNPNPCKNGGACHDLVNDYSCTCVAGYTDKDCSIDIDDCSPNPCQNGGTCHDLVNDYICTCVAGYTDKNCSTDIDDCSNPNPCHNGGTCHDLVNDFRCICVAGYTDKDCSTDIDDCKSNPCQNGGTCQDLINDFSCTCVAGYTDKDCSTDIDDCSNPNPCQNGGTCYDLVNDYSCSCGAGYTDKNCSIDIDDCSNPNPCQNGATCHDLINDYSCSCVAGYTDKNCSIDIDDCSNPNPCQNGGTCHDLVNDYRCTCVAGYTDKDCSIDIDDCLTDPCKNGGVCHDLVNDYLCVCPPGFTDKRCATNIDDCVPDPCINGGNCTDQINNFTCICQPGFAGKNCHIGIDFCEPQPCANGGICHNSFTGFTCQCVDDWRGETCDYKSAHSQRSTCTQKTANAVGNQANQDACCQAAEYSDCKCYVSPHIEPEDTGLDQATRNLLCGLVGFPSGLGLSFLTCALFRSCMLRSGPGDGQTFRAKHSPTKRSSTRTQNWVDDQHMAPVESPGKSVAHLKNGLFTSKSSLQPRSLMGDKENLPRAATPESTTSGSGSVAPMNIYRASFNDQGMPSTGPKKYLDTYGSGASDWNSTC